MRKILVTGVTGFAGSFLAEHLLKEDEDDLVSGTYLEEESLEKLPAIKRDVQNFQIDLRDSEKVDLLLQSEKPEWIFHLAALASPAVSFQNPKETILNNIEAQINLLESTRKFSANSQVLIISSGDSYGPVEKEELPIDEETAFRPTSPYAVSKIAQDYLGYQYFLSYGLKVIRARPFNHIGPRQSPQFVVSSFAKKIADIEKGKHEPILLVGNTESKRDFTDVRDTVRAYKILIEKGSPGDVYNIGSGVSYKISDILEKLLSFSTVEITVKEDPALFRPTDIEELVCDNTKIRSLGWTPKISIDQTLKDTLDYWRNIN